jgi:arsenate reductase-like glutaredoxin family protein
MLAGMALQIFGTRKCPDTRKAERFFRDRGIAYQFIDLAEKGISPGELASVAAAVGTAALIDTGGKRFKDRGLAYQDYDAEAQILADPLLLKTPIVRDGRKAVIGPDPEGWGGMLKA